MILNIITSAYLLSMIVMAFWTNIRPFYVNEKWNSTKLSSQENFDVKTEHDWGILDMIVVANLLTVAFVGK